MRLSSSYFHRHSLANILQTQENLAETTNKLSTGKRINRPSDDPYGLANGLGLQRSASKIEQYQRNIDFAESYSSAAEGALGSMTDRLQRVRELVVQAGNDTLSANDLGSIAIEVQGLIDGIRSDANTQYNNEYVFAGTASQTEPYPTGSNVYQGAVTDVTRRIDEGTVVQIDRNGQDLFGVSPANLFDTLDQIVTDLNTGTPAARNNLRGAGLTAVDGHLDNMLVERSAIGATLNLLETTRQKLEDQQLRVEETMSRIMDTDMAQAAIQLQSQNTTYEAMLLTSSRVLQTSLVNFL